MASLASLGHDPANRLKAMALAAEYGEELYTGVFYRNPEPAPTYDALIAQRKAEFRPLALPRERILDLFRKPGAR